MVFTGPSEPPLEERAFVSMAKAGASFVALVPEATVYRQTLEVRHSFPNQWYGETRAAVVEGIRLARGTGLKVMIKPHLTVGWDLSGWDRPTIPGRDAGAREAYRQSLRAFIATQEDRTTARGSWRGELDVKDEADWSRLAEGYRELVLEYARLGEEKEVGLFCIGTELQRLALDRSGFWRDLARRVREVYSGELVYAANWDSFDRIEFWDSLDYIGVDAYFPVSDARTPTADQIEAGWRPFVRRLAALHDRFERPVLFTEWGYENEDFPGKEPWVMGGGGPPDSGNAVAQAGAYEGTFRAVWSRPWLHGLFVWRWSPRRGEPGSYSPRGHEAEEVLRRWFGGSTERDDFIGPESESGR